MSSVAVFVKLRAAGSPEAKRVAAMPKTRPRAGYLISISPVRVSVVLPRVAGPSSRSHTAACSM